MGQESGLNVAKLDSLLKASQGQNYCLVLDGSCLKAWENSTSKLIQIVGKVHFLGFVGLRSLFPYGLSEGV